LLSNEYTIHPNQSVFIEQICTDRKKPQCFSSKKEFTKRYQKVISLAKQVKAQQIKGSEQKPKPIRKPGCNK
jgi:hypothetical protein